MPQGGELKPEQPLPLRQNGKATLKARVCDHVARGGSLRTLEQAGICSRPTVKCWRNADPVFETCYQRARARARARKLGPLMLARLQGADADPAIDGLRSISLAALFREWFRLSPSEAAVLHVLYQAKGLLRPAAQIAAEAGSTEGTLLRAHIPQLRRAMETEAIDTLNGCYRLTEVGMAECQDIILATGEPARTYRTLIWAPQSGPQAAFVKCPVFDVCYGGARGGGKTDACLGDFVLHQARYGRAAKGLFVRRKQVDLASTLERARALFEPAGARFLEQKSMFRFPSGAAIWFRYLERDADADNYQGHDYTRVYVEELTQFPSSRPVKFTPAKTDETGITAEMRELLARQKEGA